MTIQTEVVYLCAACGIVYDPVAGWPEEGFAPGTPWSAIPDDWRCPECGVGKSDFVATSL